MGEIIQDENQNRIYEQNMSTAELVDRSHSTALIHESDAAEESASFPPDEAVSEGSPAETLSIDDRIGGTPNEAPNGAHNVRVVGAESEPAQPNQLFAQDELKGFRSHWDVVQTSFVDEPRAAVEQADSLVANVVKRIAEQFATEREQLEKQWDRGDAVDTEELRQAFKRYRAFFDRLLAF